MNIITRFRLCYQGFLFITHLNVELCQLKNTIFILMVYMVIGLMFCVDTLNNCDYKYLLMIKQIMIEYLFILNAMDTFYLIGTSTYFRKHFVNKTVN